MTVSRPKRSIRPTGTATGSPDACDPTVYDLIATLGGPAGHGSAAVAWKTNAETNLVGFLVIDIRPDGHRIQLSDAFIPCRTCTVYGGGSYVFILAKHRGARNLYVEMHFVDGTVEPFGPATIERSAPGLMIDDPPPSVVPARAAGPDRRGGMRRM